MSAHLNAALSIVNDTKVCAKRYQWDEPSLPVITAAHRHCQGSMLEITVRFTDWRDIVTIYGKAHFTVSANPGNVSHPLLLYKQAYSIFC